MNKEERALRKKARERVNDGSVRDALESRFPYEIAGAIMDLIKR